jgi:AraC family transcriptional regulator, regulatory protein of adaptative response / methylated-DNA-[protein]-cysteine methyltransferase
MSWTKPNERWDAILKRDATADGHFWYAVRTTGIYCRPNCASRQPKRENIEFFDSPLAARKQGFRACKKCMPDSVDCLDSHLWIQQVCERIELSREPILLRDLADLVKLSQAHLQRQFKRIVGVSPKEYAARKRQERLQAELQRDQSITEAIGSAGFASSSRAYEGMTSHLGMTPNEFQQGGLGQMIQYGLTKCSLGKLLVARTTKGICFLALDDSKDALIEEVHRRFPKAKITVDESDLSLLLDQVVALIDHPAIPADLPLDILGTAFQCKVWQALREIPAGSTLTYSELAAKVGQPSAVRAVANACGANKLAVLIPCHRVIGSDGKLTGFRWGIERKRKLLERERKVSSE